MADINVQQKGASIWPWILGLLVVALLIWALMGLFDGDDEVEVVDPAAEVDQTPPAVTPMDTTFGTTPPPQ